MGYSNKRSDNRRMTGNVNIYICTEGCEKEEEDSEASMSRIRRSDNSSRKQVQYGDEMCTCDKIFIDKSVDCTVSKKSRRKKCRDEDVRRSGCKKGCFFSKVMCLFKGKKKNKLVCDVACAEDTVNRSKRRKKCKSDTQVSVKANPNKVDKSKSCRSKKVLARIGSPKVTEKLQQPDNKLKSQGTQKYLEKSVCCCPKISNKLVDNDNGPKDRLNVQKKQVFNCTCDFSPQLIEEQSKAIQVKRKASHLCVFCLYPEEVCVCKRTLSRYRCTCRKGNRSPNSKRNNMYSKLGKSITSPYQRLKIFPRTCKPNSAVNKSGLSKGTDKYYCQCAEKRCTCNFTDIPETCRGTKCC